MAGLFFLIIAWMLGYQLLNAALPRFLNLHAWVEQGEDPPPINYRLIVIAGAILVGALVLTWITYLTAYVFRAAVDPLRYGNAITGVLSIAAIVFWVGKQTAWKDFSPYRFFSRIIGGCKAIWRGDRPKILMIVALLTFSAFLMFDTFRIHNHQMKIGFSVWGDFGPHLAMIRSFSHGRNFPTEYPHFPNGEARYHFMFQFLAGNLEYLGMRLDWAFNLISILSLAAFLILLDQLAILITGRKWAGAITILLFFCRSSFAFFTFLKGIPLHAALRQILANQRFIGNTLHEDWGLWNLNVFVNQRHFAFSLGLFILVLIIMLPLLRSMPHATCDSENRVASLPAGGSVKTGRFRFRFSKDVWRRDARRPDTWHPDAWLPQSIGRPLFCGIVLGLMAFWNGAVLIAALLILFCLALVSGRRLEFLMLAVVALTISLIQTQFFIKNGGALSPGLYIGFLAAHKSLGGIIQYYLELLGVLPFIVLGGLLTGPRTLKWLFPAFCAPLILATCLSLTPDIAVNHKYVMITVILLNITAANFIGWLFTVRGRKSWFVKTTAVIILGLLTVTGIVDLITLTNINRNTVNLKVNDPFRVWVEKNTPQNAVFLTDVHSLDAILLAGRKIFYGWPYYAWSAGYNTLEREKIVYAIYGASSRQTMIKRVRMNRIQYIVIDDGNRNSRAYLLQERLIAQTFPLVYRNPEQNTRVFQTY